MTTRNDIERLKKILPILPELEKKEAINYLRSIGELTDDVVDDSGLVFNSKSVPGKGRQLRIPMYLESFDAGYYTNNIITDAGTGAPSRGNPTVLISIPSTQMPVVDQNIATYTVDDTFGHFVIKGLTFSTRQTPWSKMRVVGLETDVKYTPMSPVIPDAAGVGTNQAIGVGLSNKPRMLLKNYRVSGSANLFLQEGYIDGTFWSVKRELFGGLRAYPVLESPKTLKVDVALSGEHFHGFPVGANNLEFENGTNVPTDTNISVTVCAIVEVIDDNEFGSSESGPYARGESLQRTPPERGQAFISGE